MILPRDNEEKEELLKALVAERFQDPLCHWCEKVNCSRREEHRRLYAQRETTWRWSQEPEQLLDTYEYAVSAFIKNLPVELREAAERAVQDRYERFPRRRGRELLADQLLEVWGLLFEPTETEPPF